MLADWQRGLLDSKTRDKLEAEANTEAEERMEIMSLLGQVTALTLLILLCSIVILLCVLPHQPLLLLVACVSLPASMAMPTSSVPPASAVIEGDP